MMQVLQWSAAVGVIVSYYYLITRPRLAVWISIVACLAQGVWASLLDPIAYGVLVIEVFVIVMGIRNLYKLS